MFKDIQNFLSERANDMTNAEAVLLEECVGDAAIEDAMLGEAAKKLEGKTDEDKAVESALIDSLASDIDDDESILEDIATLDNDAEINRIADSIPGDDFTTKTKGSKIKDSDVKDAEKAVHEPTVNDLAESTADLLDGIEL